MDIIDFLMPLVSQRFQTDEKYRNGHIRVINPLPERKILGVHVPQMKALAKELSRRDDALDVICRLEKSEKNGHKLYYEETVVWGLMINYLKIPSGAKYQLLQKYIPVLDNWGVCDTFCCSAKWIKDKEELWKFLQPYWKSSREFEVRFAVIMSMVYFLSPEWFSKVCRMTDSLDFGRIHSDYVSAVHGIPAGTKGTVSGNTPYYVRMAVAWLLATALSKIPDETKLYVNNCSLPDDVIKLYARKARESFRTRHIPAF